MELAWPNTANRNKPDVDREPNGVMALDSATHRNSLPFTFDDLAAAVPILLSSSRDAALPVPGKTAQCVLATIRAPWREILLGIAGCPAVHAPKFHASGGQ
jgi:hypothetical protein